MHAHAALGPLVPLSVLPSVDAADSRPVKTTSIGFLLILWDAASPFRISATAGH